jgi:NitT/TauT family transport system substrate-binding protein
LIKSNPDLIRRFVRATMAGLRDSIGNPQQAGEIMHKYHRQVDVDIAAGESKIVAGLTDQPGLPLGTLDARQIKIALDIVGAAYQLKNPVSPEDLYAPGFVGN